MKALTKQLTKSKVLVLLAALSISGQLWANSCHEDNLHKAAWSLSPAKQKRFLSDATLEKNKSLSDGEIIDRLRTDIEKVYKARGHEKQGPFVSANSLASKIKWAAACTGNDFAMLASVIKIESAYCSILLNTNGGGDSGCGQFTSSAVGFFKNQLKLPGRKDNGAGRRMKDTIEQIMEGCAPGSSHVNKDSLHKFFSQDINVIRRELRTGKNISLDVLSTAIFLKFLYSASGFYYDAKLPGPGAFSRYNGGGHAGYGKLVNGIATRINGGVCEKDENYLKTIEKAACSLSEDKDACNMTIPEFDI